MSVWAVGVVGVVGVVVVGAVLPPPMAMPVCRDTHDANDVTRAYMPGTPGAAQP